MVRRPYRNIGDNGCLVNQCGVRDRGDIKMTSENNSMEMINMLNDPLKLDAMVRQVLPPEISGKIRKIMIKPSSEGSVYTRIVVKMLLTSPGGYDTLSYESFQICDFDRNFNVPTLVERCLKIIERMVNRIEK